MSLKEIKAADIPDWQYGDVQIKTFSYGESLRISGWAKETTDKKIEFKEGVNMDEAGVFILAAGINYVRTHDGTDYYIRPGSQVDEKAKKLYEISFQAGLFISQEITVLNKGITLEEKKN
jgi:hypothetical protein